MTPPSGGGEGADAVVGAHAGDGRIVVFACGDPFRADDAVAARAVADLPEAVVASADVRVIGGLEVEHLVDLPADVAVVIVDAVVGVAAGRIVELSLGELVTAAAGVVTTSTHQLPLDRVVALAEVLRDGPLAGRFVGLGIGSVVHGGPLSEPVTAALPAFRDAIARAVAATRGSPLQGSR